jgi:sugar phosphate permease
MNIVSTDPYSTNNLKLNPKQQVTKELEVTTDHTQSQHSRFIPWLMWFGPLVFFAYQFVIRIAPGLVMPELMQKFHIDATSFGLFASMYYLGYAGMQIPVAVLLDRVGPKKVISFCALLCSVGTLGLVWTDHWGVALLSRFFIGVGSAAGFLGTSKVISLWFAEKMYARMVGLTFTFGLMGALYGGKPVSSLITLFGWEKVLMLVGWVGLGLSVLLFVVVKNPKDFCGSTGQKRENGKHENAQHGKNKNISTPTTSTLNTSVLSDLKTILTNPKILMLALANFLMVGALEGFADVWGVPYFMETKNLPKDTAALLTSTVFFGMLFGGPLLAYFSDKLKSEAKVTIACGFSLASLFAVLLYFNASLNITMLYSIMFLTGILCCYQVLVFSMGVRLVSAERSGIAVAFLNCINMLGGSFFHSSIGKLLDLFWTGNYNTVLQVKTYEVSTYTTALSVIPSAALAGALLLVWVHRLSAKNITLVRS